jgi:hypothetical protein
MYADAGETSEQRALHSTIGARLGRLNHGRGLHLTILLVTHRVEEGQFPHHLMRGIN